MSVISRAGAVRAVMEAYEILREANLLDEDNRSILLLMLEDIYDGSVLFSDDDADEEDDDDENSA